MNVTALNKFPWFQQLAAEVQGEFARLQENREDRRPALHKERDDLANQVHGWSQTLAKPDLNPSLRAAVESQWAAALARQSEIEAELSQEERLACQMEPLIDPQDVAERLTRLAELLGAQNPTRINLELSLHIDRIDCFQDGHVTMQTCKLGALADVGQVLQADRPAELPVDPPLSDLEIKIIEPRRRARLRTEDADDDGLELEAAAHFAADPNRFGNLPEKWFWKDEFQVPERPQSWVAEHAEEVFQRRQTTRWPFWKLGEEFGVSPPTIGAAIRHHLAAHPDGKDEVQLPRGGKRKPRIDVARFAAEALELRRAGMSKEKLAEKYGCSSPVINKALAFASQQAGQPMPTRAELHTAKAAEARRLLDADHSLPEIMQAMNVSDVTVRKYLKASFAAEGKPMPDLRARRHST